MVYDYIIDVDACLFDVRLWNLEVLYIRFIDEVCVAALALAVITIDGTTFHLCTQMFFKSGLYLFVLEVILLRENLLLQYVNLII
jgi:hypothetical protein